MMPDTASTSRRRSLPRQRWWLAVLLVCVVGCGQGESRQKQTGPSETRTADNGPVKMTLTVTPSDLDFSRHAEAVVEVVHDSGVTVNVDDYGRAIRESEHRFELGVVRSERAPPEPTDDGKFVSVHRYELAFFLPGEYELPPATLTFVDDRIGDDGEEQDDGAAERTVEQLQTDSIKIMARDESGRQLTDEELRTIKTLAPIELPTVWSRWWWLGPIILIAAAAVVILLVAPLRRWFGRWLRRAGPKKVIRMPAHEWARRQLAALIAEDLIGKGLFQEFHYRISYIVRGYIERRYGVTAGEMTTEEFLAAAVRDSRFGGDTTTELERFLTACDLVKYARHQPGSGESEAALTAAEVFVERTRERSPALAASTAERGTAEERAA
jgi:hypothetical protein